MDNNENIIPMKSPGENEIIVYQPDSTLTLDVRVENETVWLNQAQMTELFQTTRNNITMHIRNIFKEGELDENSVCKESLLTAADGKRYKTKYYNLDVIISVGYRVKSLRGTQFRQWANKVLKEYLLRGYSVHSILEHTAADCKVYKTKFYDLGAILSVGYRVRTMFGQWTNKVLKEHLLRGYSVNQRLLYMESRHKIHDRFLIINDTLYHIGVSIKDLGRTFSHSQKWKYRLRLF